jgi:hypothetical protein
MEEFLTLHLQYIFKDITKNENAKVRYRGRVRGLP